MRIIKGYNPFGFQYDSITKVIEMIKTNNGACIFDQTGLGKTITSIVTASTLSNRITIICGKANKISWDKITKLYKSEYPEMDFLVTTANSLNKFDNFESDFVIVDEAHNFRNTKNKTFVDLFKFIQKNNAKVLLLTATPFNNRYSELIGMFSLINFSIDSLPFYALGDILNKIVEKEKELLTMDRFDLKFASFKHIGEYVSKEFSLRDYIEKLNLIVSTFSIRNTREYITKNYPLDVNQMGLFPVIEYKDTDSYSDSYNKLLSDNVYKTNNILKSLPLVKQNIINYLELKNNKNVNEYYDFAGLFKTLLYKRMDSSIHSFISTITNSIENLRIALENIDTENNKIKIKDNEFSLKIQATNLIELINKDIEGFTSILEIWDGFNESEKFDKLFDILKSNKGKTIIFTEYNDTLDKLVSMAKENKIKYLIYSNKSNENDLDTILTEFDANYEKEYQTDKYNVLFCTDILSEGQNLHRADNVIHFDSKWNPARMTQRNGRVDRIIINAKELKNVTVYRFGSNNIIDNIIKLEDKITTKTNKSIEFLDFVNKKYELPRFNNFKKDQTLGYYSDKALPEMGYVIRNNEYDFCISINGFFIGDNITVSSTEFLNDTMYLGKLVDGSEIDNFVFRHRNNYIHAFRNELSKNHKYNSNKDNSFLYFTNPLYSNIFVNIVSDIKTTKLNENVEWLYNVLTKKNSTIESCKLILSKTGIIYEGQKLEK